MPQGVEDLAAKWDALGRDDPLWAILTDPSKAGGRWSPEEFFATGRSEIEEVFAQLDALGVAVGRGAALDFGCGVGRLTQALAGRFDQVVGLDVAPSMIELAIAHNRNGLQVTYRVNRSPALEGVETGSLDFIYSNIVLQHIPPRISTGYIAEFARAMRPGGVAVFQVPSRPRTLTGRVKSFVKQRLPAFFAVLKAARRRRPTATMDMYGVPRNQVESILRTGGCDIRAVLPDETAGADWASFRYVALKRS